ncbi:Do family serine endopeptidase [Aromatoleum petrolei]|uniref:Probable periplasmic serine endoprotease DegP-like n=1 Tax=Aromatoleum petrolei TaxID=76116 RepID=A0ABX1MQ38_9RHOO|nr:Do family serine endopeptidase [Aromatoleum petrolei]NMF89335.1 Do family serine endopeptidase [Aromatoleum petrolei]QTQ35165.1 Putative periplasmic serine endoprotease, DegP-like [Aromatoleum petrolei]
MNLGRLLRAIVFALSCAFAVTSAYAAGGVIALPDFTQIVQRHGAAVVNISAAQAGKGAGPGFPQLSPDDPMFDFFRRFVPRKPEHPRIDPDNKSLGSGFIVSADGYILTNAHVVEGAEEIIVRLVDKREFRARVVGADARSDVALIKIDATDLPRLAIGDPEKLQVGEWVVAIGSPFGFDHSVTAGIVSAKGRSLPDENFVPFIQTDVAINPGNSGGPLFNLKGEVVGINSQIYSQTGGFMGLSFAIPINLAMEIQAQLKASGRVQRGRIGVAIQEVTRSLAESFALPRAEGALVSAVEPEGPAARAGIQQGDVIVRFAGKAVDESSDLPRIVSSSRPGAQVSLSLYRAGVLREVGIMVGEWADEGAPRSRRSERAQPASNKLGLVLGLPTPAQKRERNVEHGLVIERAQGAAARADLQVGDIVLAMVSSGRQVALKTVDGFTRLAADIKDGQLVTLLVHRGSGTSYVTLRAGD